MRCPPWVSTTLGERHLGRTPRLILVQGQSLLLSARPAALPAVLSRELRALLDAFELHRKPVVDPPSPALVVGDEFPEPANLGPRAGPIPAIAAGPAPELNLVVGESPVVRPAQGEEANV